MDMGIEKNSSAMTTDSYNLNGLKILLAEDNKLNILIVRNILSPWNIEIAIAENGQIAVEMAKTKSFDVILMDVQMPVMDGLEASREILKMNRKAPIVVVTSLPSSEVKENFNNLGITEFVFKPFNKEYLYQILQKYALINNRGNDEIPYYIIPEVPQAYQELHINPGA
jgi:CheY-like chemotaxis protein